MHGPTFDSKPRDYALLLDFEGDRREIGAYRRAGGYEQLLRATSMTNEQIVQALKDSGLRGRGGAGFPTGLKASFLAPGEERYLVVNADESEPGTFKDRELMLRNPHALLEGILIACWAIKATAAYIYIRGEYLREAEVLTEAIAQATTHGYVARPLPGTDYACPIYVHRGAGAYICGEETALLSSLNGFRGQPTAKPPFPAVSGAFRRPTLLNNVETIAAVPFILRVGAEAYKALGTEQSGGTRLFSLSGNVRRPGNYEMLSTMTFRDLIEGRGGGVPEGRTLKAFVPGGSSTPILMPDDLDVGLAYEAVQAAGSMSGSAATVVLDDRVCMVQFALRVAQFYRHESCGKCTPCREGTRWTVETLRRMLAGDSEPSEIDLVLSICDRIEGNCLCPLGDAMAMPVRSYIKQFRPEFEACIENGGSTLAAASPLTSLTPTISSPLPMVAS
jgi:NADH-quinone oxidoreductase subunit F